MSEVALQERIASALTTSLPSAELEKLMAKVIEERWTVREVAETAEQRSLDPALPSKVAGSERARAQEAKFSLDRIEAAETKLGAALKAAIAREENERNRANFDRVRAERDALTEDLKRYPTLARELVALLSRIDDNDKALETANRRLPSGEKALFSAEVVARGIPSYLRDAGGLIPRLRDVCLPAFKRDDVMRPYFWHPHLSSDQRNQG